ncbi:pectate lyase [Butyrivibrio sp. DSM 10294]|uniref:pectate lyase n=1 Tax=Butyrivibrio sp. DSM 10294 TaxID=2972457 RepID=UPI00234F9014|nr:pectate lyase [Butyrivibrio sp. DSM 10294]MDC7293477.1 pectate lyase [Butyrivibrio sp. DSM 10294]
MKRSFVRGSNGFKRGTKVLTGIMLAAMLAVSPVSAVMPQSVGTMTVYAGSNDFSWSTYSKKSASWWKSSEATGLADEMIKYQLSDGGWRKDMKTSTSGSWNKSTIDNNATWGQIRFLANVYAATGTYKYRQSCEKGLTLLFNGQYSNGGWPQVFNDAGTYHAHITYNDNAMVNVLKIMQEVSQKSGAFSWVDNNYQSKAANALDKGVQCILNTQITINGTLTAWGQQHNEYTLAPDSARAYELASVCSSESAAIVTFLRDLPKEKQSNAVIKSINAAVRWFDAVKIENKKWDWNSNKTDKVLTTSYGSTIWARFYDLNTNKPLFADRDGKAYDDVTKISQERRTGYSWYGTWCADNLKKGTLPENSGSGSSTSNPSDRPGTNLYVGYSNKSGNYSTVQAAVDAAAKLNPKSEQQRVYIHIAPGTYRQQVIVNTPYISFINDQPSQEVKLTWYYGIGYKYYSMGSNGYYDANKAKSKSGMGEATRWGSTVGLKGNADYFRAEYITFENSFNKYVTDEEIADGVTPSGSESITFQRRKGVDVTSKTATERAAAIAVEGDYSEFYNCTFLGSQDTLFTRGNYDYYRDCHVVGNTDYIFGQGIAVFQNCELEFAGYSDKAVGGYITAMKSDGRSLFYDCKVTANGSKKVASGYFGRPWGDKADVAFVNTELAYESLITSAGWTSMSGNAPENANFKEYNTTAGGRAVNTSGRVRNTVKYSGNGLDVLTYFGGNAPYYYNYSGSSQSGATQPEPQPEPDPQPSEPVNTGSTGYVEDGWYYIKGVQSQKYLTVNADNANGWKSVVIKTGTGVDAQKWYLTNVGNGYITLTNKLGNVMLDVANGEDTDGADIGIYQAYGGNAQQFILKTTDQSGVFTIGTKCSSATKTLDVYAKKTADGTNVCQWTYNGKPNQQWQFEKVAEQTQEPTPVVVEPDPEPVVVEPDPEPVVVDPDPVVEPDPEPVVEPEPVVTGGLELSYSINSWGSGYQASFKITNNSGSTVNGWTLKINKNQVNLDSYWNVDVKTSGNYYVITPLSWNATIANGQSIEFGAIGTGQVRDSFEYTLE